jgi:hypothetical protein
MLCFRYLGVVYLAFLSLAYVMASTSAQDVDPSPNGVRRRVMMMCFNNYRCPQYSYRKPGRYCCDSFDDCVCVDKYHKEGKYCVKDNDKCNYSCPKYSYRKPGRSCYDDFNDCVCDKGYKKYNNKCVKNS